MHPICRLANSNIFLFCNIFHNLLFTIYPYWFSKTESQLIHESFFKLAEIRIRMILRNANFESLLIIHPCTIEHKKLFLQRTVFHGTIVSNCQHGYGWPFCYWAKSFDRTRWCITTANFSFICNKKVTR